MYTCWYVHLLYGVSIFIASPVNVSACIWLPQAKGPAIEVAQVPNRVHFMFASARLTENSSPACWRHESLVGCNYGCFSSDSSGCLWARRSKNCTVCLCDATWCFRSKKQLTTRHHTRMTRLCVWATPLQVSIYLINQYQIQIIHSKIYKGACKQYLDNPWSSHQNSWSFPGHSAKAPAPWRLKQSWMLLTVGFIWWWILSPSCPAGASYLVIKNDHGTSPVINDFHDFLV